MVAAVEDFQGEGEGAVIGDGSEIEQELFAIEAVIALRQRFALEGDVP